MSTRSTEPNLWHDNAREIIEVTSTDRQDITEFLNEVRGLIREIQLVLVNENRV